LTTKTGSINVGVEVEDEEDSGFKLAVVVGSCPTSVNFTSTESGWLTAAAASAAEPAAAALALELVLREEDGVPPFSLIFTV
jgi:hypothetical protein